MITLYEETDGMPSGLHALLSRVCLACCEIEGIAQGHALVKITDDDALHEINLRFRGIDRPTDVLSFPSIQYKPGRTAKNAKRRLLRNLDPESGLIYLGDIAISLPRAEAQAKEYGHSLERELAYLTAHALFHLMGYDHETAEEKAQMRRLEKSAMLSVGLSGEDEQS